MRNISAKMRVDDRQKALDEFKQIHTQSNKEMAVQVLHEFYQNWEKAYKNVVRDLRQVEPDLLTFYNYPPAIRASIYSTNMIESFNNRLKRKTKPKTEFPTEQSLDTFIGVQAMDYNDRYFNRIHKEFGQVRDTLESYFEKKKKKKVNQRERLFTQTSWQSLDFSYVQYSLNERNRQFNNT